MNELKDLVQRLDGLSIESIGFMILKATKNNALWSLKVQGYYKKLDDSTSEDTISILPLVERIENKYDNKLKWKILHAEVTKGNNIYNLIVMKCLEDNKNEENHNPKGEQVEVEE